MVVATMEEVVAAWVDWFATLTKSGLQVWREDGQSQFSLEHNGENVVWEAAVGLLSGETV